MRKLVVTKVVGRKRMVVLGEAVRRERPGMVAGKGGVLNLRKVMVAVVKVVGDLPARLIVGGARDQKVKVNLVVNAASRLRHKAIPAVGAGNVRVVANVAAGLKVEAMRSVPRAKVQDVRATIRVRTIVEALVSKRVILRCQRLRSTWRS